MTKWSAMPAILLGAWNSAKQGQLLAGLPLHAVQNQADIGNVILLSGSFGLTNYGIIRADGNAQTIEISQIEPFLNFGTLAATNNGILQVNATNWVNAGTMTATGAALVLGGTWSSSGS